MDNLNLAKSIIKEYFPLAKCGIFNSPNLSGDKTTVLYRGNRLTIQICYYWEYFEVFGLTKKEFLELTSFYESLF